MRKPRGLALEVASEFPAGVHNGKGGIDLFPTSDRQRARVRLASMANRAQYRITVKIDHRPDWLRP